MIRVMFSRSILADSERWGRASGSSGLHIGPRFRTHQEVAEFGEENSKFFGGWPADRVGQAL